MQYVLASRSCSSFYVQRWLWTMTCSVSFRANGQPALNACFLKERRQPRHYGFVIGISVAEHHVPACLRRRLEVVTPHVCPGHLLAEPCRYCIAARKPVWLFG